MAGNYPDPPGPKLALDKDGTVGVALNAAATALIRTFSAAEMGLMLDDQTTGPTANFSVAAFIFPSPRTITHAYTAWVNANPQNPFCQTSVDTTNGMDGTWLAGTGITNQGTAGFDKVAARSPNALSANGVGIKGIRFRDQFANRALAAVHLWGYPSSPGDRLEWWHPTLDQPLRDTPALYDWGDRPVSSSATKQFRVKNTSATLTANSITIDPQDQVPAPSPTLESQVQVRYAGGAYGATATIASLAPGAISDLVEVKQDLLSTAAFGVWNQRVSAVAASWS